MFRHHSRIVTQFIRTKSAPSAKSLLHRASPSITPFQKHAFEGRRKFSMSSSGFRGFITKTRSAFTSRPTVFLSKSASISSQSPGKNTSPPSSSPIPPPSSEGTLGILKQAMQLPTTEGGAKAVYLAVATNTIVMLGKLAAYVATGSATMLSEVFHSLADIANQILLAIGIARAKQAPTPVHPYGFANERYVWALISAVGTFFLGCLCAIYQGIVHYFNPAEIVSPEIALGILALSGIAEGATFLFALRVMQQAAQKQGISIWKYFTVLTDPMAMTVLLEDGASLAGIVIAGMCIGLTHVTGIAAIDAIGSIMIGGLLGAVATYLIKFNRDLLVGKAMPPQKLDVIVNLIKNDSAVVSVRDVKGMSIGAENLRFKAEVHWNGRAIAAAHCKTLDLEKIYKEIDSKEKLEAFLVQYGDEIVSSMGKEVDRLEKQIKLRIPEVRHVDLEAD